MVTTDTRSLIIQHEFYRKVLSKSVDEGNIEADIHLSRAETDEEKVYE